MNYIQFHEKSMPLFTFETVAKIQKHLEEHKFSKILEESIPSLNDMLEAHALYYLINQIELELIRYAIHLFSLSHPPEPPVAFISNLLANQTVKNTISKQTVEALHCLRDKDRAFNNILDVWSSFEVLGEQPKVGMLWDEEMNQQDLRFFRPDLSNKIKDIHSRIGNLTLAQSSEVVEILQSLRKNFERQKNQKVSMHKQLKKFFQKFGLQYAPDCANLEAQDNKLQQQIQEQQNKLKTCLQDLAKQKQHMYNSLQRQILQKGKQQQKIRIQHEQNNSLRIQIQSLKNELKLETTQNDQASKQHKLNTKKIEDLTTQLASIKQSQQSLIHQKQNLKAEIKNIIQSFQEQLCSKQLIINQRYSELLSLTLTNNQLKTKNSQLTNQSSQLKSTIASLQLHIQDLQSNLITVKQNLINERLFSHDILHNRPEDNLFLTSTLKNRYNSPVQSTKLLCKYDPINKINFHKYIDNIPCILMVAKVDNGTIVAGFSLSPLFMGSKSQEALIIAVTSRQVIYLKAGGRGVTYDEYFLIFGNSELRIKSGQLLIFSNLGVNNSYFDSRGLTVNTLFGHEGKEREVKIEKYEIYQVIFKDKPYITK